MPRLERIQYPRRCTPALAVLLMAALGCGDDAESPTAPEAPSLLATSTTHLAFAQVSAGAAHTCAVTTDNRAFCWGSGSWGQLGDGSATDSPTPIAVAGTFHFRQVSAGGAQSCGVTTDNRAYCWGFGGDGALGDGTTADHPTPVAVSGGRLFRQLEAGESYACGVSYPDNKAYCWGWNGLGQLGDGTTTSRLAPVAVAGGRRFRQVSVGQQHACGVTTSDEAFCWGWNRFGQVGDSLTGAPRLTPSRVAGGRRFRLVDAGAFFTCGVTTNNRAYCWGNGAVGQMGIGKTSNPLWPKTAVAGGLSFRRVSAGGFHACGETTLNRAYCWGWNSEGAVGDGTKTMRLTPVAVAGGHFFRQLSAGTHHTCGRASTNVVYCWGGPTFGQLTPSPVAGGN